MESNLLGNNRLKLRRLMKITKILSFSRELYFRYNMIEDCFGIQKEASEIRTYPKLDLQSDFDLVISTVIFLVDV